MTKSYPETLSNAGLVYTNRVRETGTLVSLYRSAEAGIEDDPSLPFTTVCETHGGCVCHATKSLAVSWVAHPRTWCEGCRQCTATGGDSTVRNQRIVAGASTKRQQRISLNEVPHSS